MRIPLIAGGGGMRERRFLTVVSGDEAEAWAAECGFQSLSFVLESVSRKSHPAAEITKRGCEGAIGQSKFAQ